MNIVTRRSFPDFPVSLDRVFGSLFADPFALEVAPANGARALALDVSETESEVIVRASLPGYKKEEIDIEVHDGILTIRGEHSETTEESGEHFHRRERRTGSVTRSISLPDTVADDKVNAELADGVLTVKLAKSPAEKPRKIAIK